MLWLHSFRFDHQLTSVSLFCLFELSDMLIITVTTCISRSLFCLMYYWVALQNILGERKSYTLCLDFLCYNLCHTNWHGEKKPSFTGLLRYLFCSCSHVQTSQLWVPAFCFLFLPPVMQHSFCTMWLHLLPSSCARNSLAVFNRPMTTCVNYGLSVHPNDYYGDIVLLLHGSLN